MNGGTWKTTIVQEIVKEIGCLLVIDKDDRACRRHGQQQVKDAITLLGFIDKKNLESFSFLSAIREHRAYLLGDIDVRRSSSSNTNANVILSHVFLGHSAGFLRKSGREHHVDVIIVIVGICEESASAEDVKNWRLTSAHNLAHIVHPVGAHHFISLVNDGVSENVSFVFDTNREL